MTTYIALLRGVNLAGNKMVAMADVRALITRLGFSDVRTLLNSGTAVFRGPRKSPAQIEKMLEAEVDVSVFVRTSAEWKEIVAANRLTDEVKRDPSRVLMTALKDAPSAEDVKALREAITGPEIVHVDGRHAYFFYPEGLGNSRLTNVVIEKKLRTRGTARNWNTVLKVDAIL